MSQAQCLHISEFPDLLFGADNCGVSLKGTLAIGEGFTMYYDGALYSSTLLTVFSKIYLFSAASEVDVYMETLSSAAERLSSS